MRSQPAPACAPQSRREVLIDWLALAVLLGLGILAPAHESAGVLADTPPAAGAP
jgi:hypothetical protein